MTSTTSPTWICPIVLSYTPEQYSRKIWPEDVVHPLNHCYTIKSSRKVRRSWRSKTRGGMPAYSNCTYCGKKSGPLGRHCNECNHQMAGYVIFTKQEKEGPRYDCNPWDPQEQESPWDYNRRSSLPTWNGQNEIVWHSQDIICCQRYAQEHRRSWSSRNASGHSWWYHEPALCHDWIERQFEDNSRSVLDGTWMWHHQNYDRFENLKHPNQLK